MTNTTTFTTTHVDQGFKVCAAAAISNAAPLSNTIKSPFWYVLSGRGYCEIVDGGRCVTDGAGKYGNNERCEVLALRPLELKTTQYAVESNYDFIAVAGVQYKKNCEGPNGLSIS